MRLSVLLFITVSCLWFSGCAGVPSGVEPVDGFEVDRYMGKWYEIARLDHRFERNMSNVTAEYELKDKGGLDVTNRGYNETAEEWKEANADAWFRGDPSVASLKVQFFWPFYGGYHVIALDKQDYQWAMVCGPNKDYLWILCRDPEMNPELKSELIAKAQGWGFDIDELIEVAHDRAKQN